MQVIQVKYFTLMNGLPPQWSNETGCDSYIIRLGRRRIWWMGIEPSAFWRGVETSLPISHHNIFHFMFTPVHVTKVITSLNHQSPCYYRVNNPTGTRNENSGRFVDIATVSDLLHLSHSQSTCYLIQRWSTQPPNCWPLCLRICWPHRCKKIQQ